MIVEGHHLRLIRGPRENHHRPAIDPTFRSAVLAYGPRVIGVVLTGSLDDRTGGLMVVPAHEGEAIFQDSTSALFPSMPANAPEDGARGLRGPVGPNPGAHCEALVCEPMKDLEPAASTDALSVSDVRMAEPDMSEVENDIHAGKPSVFGCPECGGVLWEINQEGLLRFRCRVGHTYTAQHLRAEQRQVIESALMAALRALEESASLYRRLAARAKAANLKSMIKDYEERAATAELNSRALRDSLVHVIASESEVDIASQPVPQAKAS
jgi:two-component system chemotaxis response regulator CheB